MLEEFRGGINSFVHVSLPDEILVEIEENTFKCQDCGHKYLAEDVTDHDRKIYISKYMPEDGHCNECGSSHISHDADPSAFEAKLEAYKKSKEEILGFYDHLGLLVDVQLNKGFEDYELVRQKMKHGMKH